MTLYALVGGLGVSAVYLANEREALAESEAATARAAEAADLLAGLFSAANPEPVGGRPVTAREALDQDLARVGKVESEPLRAYLQRVLEETNIQTGNPVLADSHLSAALGLLGEDAVGEEATRIRLNLAATRAALDDPNGVLALAPPIYRNHGRDADSDRALHTLWVINHTFIDLGLPDSALQLARRAEELTREGASRSRRIRVLAQLGNTYLTLEEYAEAAPMLQRANALSLEEAGPESVRASGARHDLARAKAGLGQFAEAEALLRASETYPAKVFGWDTGEYVLATLADVQFRAGDYRAAAATLAPAIAMKEPRLQPDRQDIGLWLAQRADALNRAGDYRSAEDVARRVVGIADAQTHADRPLGSETARSHLRAGRQAQGGTNEAGRFARASWE